MGMNLYQILSLVLSVVGIPTLSALTGCLFSKTKHLMKAHQMMIRHDLMDMYHACIGRGCISDDDIELFEDMYNAYHALGKNGVMDSRREELLKLPKVKFYEKKEKKVS